LEILAMKKSLLALAVLSAFAGAASAQSSVTLSGGIDAAIQRVNGGVEHVDRQLRPHQLHALGP
jgi:predicted porin